MAGTTRYRGSLHEFTYVPGHLTKLAKSLSSLQLALFDRCSGGSRFEQVLLWYVAYVWTVAKHFRCSDISLGVTYVNKYETRGVGDGNKRQGRPMRWQSDCHLHTLWTVCRSASEQKISRTTLPHVTTVQHICFMVRYSLKCQSSYMSLATERRSFKCEPGHILQDVPFRRVREVAKKRLLASWRLSVCPSARNNFASAGRIFVKLSVWVFTKIYRQNLSLVKIGPKITDILHAFMISVVVRNRGCRQ